MLTTNSLHSDDKHLSFTWKINGTPLGNSKYKTLFEYLEDFSVSLQLYDNKLGTRWVQVNVMACRMCRCEVTTWTNTDLLIVPQWKKFIAKSNYKKNHLEFTHRCPSYARPSAGEILTKSSTKFLQSFSFSNYLWRNFVDQATSFKIPDTIKWNLMVLGVSRQGMKLY